MNIVLLLYDVNTDGLGDNELSDLLVIKGLSEDIAGAFGTRTGLDMGLIHVPSIASSARNMLRKPCVRLPVSGAS